LTRRPLAGSAITLHFGIRFVLARGESHRDVKTRRTDPLSMLRTEDTIAGAVLSSLPVNAASPLSAHERRPSFLGRSPAPAWSVTLYAQRKGNFGTEK